MTCVASSVICSVIDFKIVLTVYCKQHIIQLYFERRICYGNVAKVLAVEGVWVPEQMVWATIYTEVQDTWNDFFHTTAAYVLANL